MRGLGGGTCAHVELGVGLASSCSCGLRVGRLAGGKLGHYNQGWGSVVLGGKNRLTSTTTSWLRWLWGRQQFFSEWIWNMLLDNFQAPKLHTILSRREIWSWKMWKLWKNSPVEHLVVYSKTVTLLAPEWADHQNHLGIIFNWLFKKIELHVCWSAQTLSL